MMGSSVSVKIQALESVAEAFTREGFQWAVCNGLEDYPSGIGRDLDIVIEQGMLRRALGTACNTLQNDGWTVLPNLQGWIWWVVVFKKSENGGFDSLQLDLFEHLQWAFTWVVDGVGRDGPLVQRGPFLEDPAANLGKTLIIGGLSRGSQAFEKKPEYLELEADELSFLQPILKRIGDAPAEPLKEAILQRSPRAINLTFKKLRSACYLNSLCRSGRLKRFTSVVLKQWVVNIRPKKGGPVVQILGDSIETTTQIVETIKRELQNLVYHEVVEYSEAGSLKERHQQLRRSCLQAVSLYVNCTPPKGLDPDIELRIQGEILEFRVNGPDLRHTGRGREDTTIQTLIHQSLNEYFSFRSNELLKEHSILTN
ncbi:hypothetical protein N9F48_01710 [Akkermansiaceae bacterium]|nr:hypothetical protein [Akkermansiaceae bacterium]